MKFSILVPAYKPQFLAECIESILAQTYPDWELIIVNDASPYDIDNIVGKYSDSRIKYYKREKGFGAERLVDNWNECLSYATGEYVINMGDDDKLCPNCLLDYSVLIMKYPGKHIYHTRVEYINELSEVTKIQNVRPEEESVYNMVLRKLNGCRICIGEFLFERISLINRGGFYNIPYAWGADDLSSCEAAKNMGCANCNQAGFQYRDSCFSVSADDRLILTKYDIIQIWEKWLNQFLQDVPKEKCDQVLYYQIKEVSPRRLRILRQSYIDIDIKQRYLCGVIYWLKRMRWDKSAEIKRRTLFVFLYYALINCKAK